MGTRLAARTGAYMGNIARKKKARRKSRARIIIRGNIRQSRVARLVSCCLYLSLSCRPGSSLSVWWRVGWRLLTSCSSMSHRHRVTGSWFQLTPCVSTMSSECSRRWKWSRCIKKVIIRINKVHICFMENVHCRKRIFNSLVRTE